MNDERDVDELIDAVLHTRHDPVDNVAACRRALQVIAPERHGELWATTAEFLVRSLGKVHVPDLDDNVAEARTIGRRALEFCRQEGLANRVRSLKLALVMVEYNFANRYFSRRDGNRAENIESSIKHFEIALEGYTKIKDEEPAYWADAHLGLADCYCERQFGSRADNFENAIKSYQAALTVWSIHRDLDKWARCMLGLGAAYDRRIAGSRTENVELSLRTFREVRDALATNGDAIQRSSAEHGLGIVYSQRHVGDRAENIELSIKHLTASLQGIDRMGDPRNWASTQQALGAAYDYRLTGDRSSNLDQAIRHFEAALDALDRDEFPDLWGVVQRSLGLVHMKKHGMKDSIEHLESALQVRTRERNPREWALTTDTLAGAYLQRREEKDVVRAISALQETAEVHDPLTDPDNWLKHQVILAEGLRLFQGRCSLPERIEILDGALKYCTAGDRPDMCEMIAVSLGSVRAEFGDWAGAAEAFSTALAAVETLHSGAVTSAARQRHAESSGSVARLTSYALARVGRLWDAVVVLERARARALGNAHQLDRQVLERMRKHRPQLVKPYLEAWRRWRTVQNTEINATPGELVELAVRWRSASAELDRLTRQVGDAFPSVQGVDTVTAAVEQGHPVAYVNTTPWGTLTLFLVRREVVEVEALWAHDFTETDLDAVFSVSTAEEPSLLGRAGLLGGYYHRMLNLYETTFEDGSSALTHGPWGTSSVARTAKDESGATAIIGERVMSGINDALLAVEANQVVLIPCGRTCLLPLHAAEFGDGRCLLNDVDVAYAPSARGLNRARDELRRDRGEQMLAAIGNPLPHPAPLEFAAIEVEQISRLFDSGRSLCGKDATKADVLRVAMAASHVHLACHGSYKLEDDAPHLQFANAEPLTLGEITRNRPFADARLVVMSACQTALVRIKAHGDGASLPTAIMASGTSGVIATLWAVDDLSTALLMDRFYTLHLHGEDCTGALPPHRALARAQRWLARVTSAELHEYFLANENLRRIALEVDSGSRYPAAMAAMNAAKFGLDEPEHRPFANSYYWAPFIFLGA